MSSFETAKGQMEGRLVAHLNTLKAVKSESPSGLTKQGRLIDQALLQAEELVRNIQDLKLMP